MQQRLHHANRPGSFVSHGSPMWVQRVTAHLSLRPESFSIGKSFSLHAASFVISRDGKATQEHSANERHGSVRISDPEPASSPPGLDQKTCSLDCQQDRSARTSTAAKAGTMLKSTHNSTVHATPPAFRCLTAHSRSGSHGRASHDL